MLTILIVLALTGVPIKTCFTAIVCWWIVPWIVPLTLIGLVVWSVVEEHYRMFWEKSYW